MRLRSTGVYNTSETTNTTVISGFQPPGAYLLVCAARADSRTDKNPTMHFKLSLSMFLNVRSHLDMINNAGYGLYTGGKGDVMAAKEGTV